MDNKIIKDYCQAIKSRISQGDYPAALGIADKLAYNFPNNEKGYYYRAICFFALEKLDESVANYRMALRYKPTYAKAYFNLGTCYQQLRYYDLALINFGKALILFTNQGKREARDKAIEAIRYVESERKRK